ncbi:hypothetical protein ACP4OV_007147 [Aristida adscensionis]
MACGLLLQPAAAASVDAAVLWPRRHLPAPRRSSAAKERHRRSQCMDQFHLKLPFSAAQPHWSRSLVGCKNSVSSAEVAALSRPKNVSTSLSDLSTNRRKDSVPGELIIICGYWTGPDVDDGGGIVEAMLQRII